MGHVCWIGPAAFWLLHFVHSTWWSRDALQSFAYLVQPVLALSPVAFFPDAMVQHDLFVPWPTRQVLGEKLSSDRLFPLPYPIFNRGGGGECKRARRRSSRRSAAWGQACETVAALNALFGCSSAADSGAVSPAQTSLSIGSCFALFQRFCCRVCTDPSGVLS